ncbi:MAG: hypothetical protein WCS77_07030 [Elusimicrobiaceae bacterium]
MPSVITIFQHITPAISAALFLALALLLYENRKIEWPDLKNMGWKNLLLLGLAVACAVVLQFFCEPKHILYIDEFWYLEAAKKILTTGWAAGYEKSIGWPVMAVAGYLAGGLNNFPPIYLDIALGLLCVPAAYLAAYAISKNRTVAAATAFTLALLPYRTVWAATAETGVASLLFITAGVYLSFAYYRNRSLKALITASVAWACAAQIRPENLIFLALFWLGKLLFMEKAERRENIAFYTALFSIAAVNAPNFTVFANFQSSTNWLETDSFGKMSGASISPANLWFNTIHWAPRFFDLSMHGALFTLLFLGGAAAAFWKERKQFYFLAAWFLLMYVFYFSTWFHVYGTTTDLFPKTKLFLLFYPVLGMFAGYAMAFLLSLNRIFAGAAVALFSAAMLWNVSYAKKAHFKNAPRTLETRILSGLDKTVPEMCAIVTNSPVTVLATNFHKAVYATPFAQNDDYAREQIISSPCIYYLSDITEELGVTEFTTNAALIAAKYNLSEFSVFTLRGTTYRIFKIGQKKQPSARSVNP